MSKSTWCAQGRAGIWPRLEQLCTWGVTGEAADRAPKVVRALKWKPGNVDWTIS